MSNIDILTIHAQNRDHQDTEMQVEKKCLKKSSITDISVNPVQKYA